jgi:hypothetical protein
MGFDKAFRISEKKGGDRLTLDINISLNHLHQKGGEKTMKKWIVILCAIFAVAFIMSCTGEKVPENLEISLTPVKGYEGSAEGKAVIKNGEEVSLNLTGLNPEDVYTAFFVNVKSQMFEGIGQKPYVLSVAQDGTVNADLKITKNIYKKFIRIAIYLNPDKQPIENPLGVKATLGALIKEKKPTMILEGKLR